MKLPYDSSIEAEYLDGFVLSETEHDDVSPYDTTANIFNDVLQKRPEAAHGPLVRFTVFYKDHAYNIDWAAVPANSRPIRWRRYELDYNGPNAGISRLVEVGFGYQYTDEHGKNVTEEQIL